MLEIKVDEALWASTMMPKGILERWFRTTDAIVSRGDQIAEIRIEGAIHEIVSPGSGTLTIVAATNSIVEPGSLLGTLSGGDV
jgi:hypothetical protein